jgi:hypothetical protein
MPPAWKTFDEQTAAALKDRIDEASVSVESITQPLFSDGDSVVIAPTLQKGAALVITARRKMAPITVEEPAQFSPLIEEIASPEILPAPDVEEIAASEAPEPVVTPEETAIEATATGTSSPESEFTFGPTTWERVDEVEAPAEFTPIEREIHSTDPEIWDLPSQAPPSPPIEEVASERTVAPKNAEWEEERYVATGFLGLDDYVEDEEEIRRAKRPWWKRIFTD